MRLVFSVDVEEEGLFRGQYERRGTLANVAELERLSFVTTEFGIPLTLLCTHAVASDPGATNVLRRLHEHQGAELGAHLHHWATPPYAEAEQRNDIPPVPCVHLDSDLLADKLDSLFSALKNNTGVPPLSFRMGRWDACPTLFDLLAQRGIVADSSIVPLRHVPGRPGSEDIFLTPSAPHILDTKGGRLAEVPLTLLPVLQGTDTLADAAARRIPKLLSDRLLSDFRKILATGPQPVWYPLASMKLAARLAMSRGQDTMVLFLHSSELLPGAHPKLPDKRAVDALLLKIRLFLEWLRSVGPLTGTTLKELGKEVLQ